MMLKRFACGLALLCLPLAAQAQSPQTTWVNDHAQLVIQSIDGEGRITGTYTNCGPGFGCANRAFPVTGWVDGDMISFAAHRKDSANCIPIQSWTGIVREGQLLVEFLALRKEGGQTDILKGSDRYRRQ